MINNVQAWLDSFNNLNRIQGFKTLPDSYNNPLEAVPGFPLSGDLKNLDSDTLTTIVNRLDRFRREYSTGEDRREPGSTDRKYLDFKDIMARHPNLSMRSAKRILANIRFFMQKRPGGKITVKVYCLMMNENEEDTQTFLQELDEQPIQENLPS